MLCEPAVKADVYMVAKPPLITAVPSTAEPSRNWTPPVAELGVTAAESEMLVPKNEGFCELVSTTFEAALFTVCARLADVLAVVLLSPL